jgi:hypothetical protein
MALHSFYAKLPASPSLPLGKNPNIAFTLCKQVRLTLEDIVREPAGRPARFLKRRWSETAMRKIVGLLDEEQREALLELVDFATAAFSAGLAVAVLKGAVDLVALFI